MFDTIRLVAYHIMIESDRLDRHKAIGSSTKLDEDTGELKTYLQFKGDKLPFIYYSTASSILIIEASIPKLLYGENISIVKQNDIGNFFAIVEQELSEMFGVKINPTEWNVLRIDVCWNFQVGRQITDYIKKLSQQQLPKMTTSVINQVETVMFHNKSRKIIFYDKEKESRAKRNMPDVVERAKGVLRLEIRPSRYDMKKYSSTRKAVDLLTKDFFRFVTEPILNLTASGFHVDFIPFAYVQCETKKVELGLGFRKLLEWFGVAGVKKLFKSSTFESRTALLKELSEITNKQSELLPLSIDFERL